MSSYSSDTTLSLIIPIYNRYKELSLSLTCLSHSNYDLSKVEIIISAREGRDYPKIKELPEKFKGVFKEIKVLSVPNRIPGVYYLSIDDSCCPALQQNVGIAAATGEILIFTSPEVLIPEDGLDVLSKVKEKEFLYLHVVENEEDLSEEQLLALSTGKKSEFEKFRENNRYHSRCPDRNGKIKGRYFCGSIHKVDVEAVGGIDEIYMNGTCADDDDFAERLSRIGVVHTLNTSTFAIHLNHPKAYREKTPEALSARARNVQMLKRLLNVDTKRYLPLKRSQVL